MTWNITDDKFKDNIIKYMGERWKAWKIRLRRNFITNADPENPKYPWEHGQKVEPAEWEEFKAYVDSAEFKVLWGCFVFIIVVVILQF